MSIIKRPPGDDFTFKLFFKLTNKVKQTKNSIYIWSAVLDPSYTSSWIEDDVWMTETELDYRKHLIDDIKNDLIIIGIKDHLSSSKEQSRDRQKIIPIIAEYLKSLVEYYSEKRFILFTSVENLEAYIQNKNAIIIPWGGDITNHQKNYITLEPVLGKNFDSTTTFLSLNRNQRPHRAMLVSLLYKLGLQDLGLISCMFKDKVDNLFEYTGWESDKQGLFEEGFKIFKQEQLSIIDSYDIYDCGPNDNVSNFKNKLTPYYQNTFVEIITETSYAELCYNLTEKTLNSIYGCCFPILLCSKGSVSFLRNMGMDMFDDVVDHSYDDILDPTDRIYRAITDNKEILVNIEHTKELWKTHKHRFINNIDFAKTTLYNFYSLRAEQLMLKAINDHNL